MNEETLIPISELPIKLRESISPVIFNIKNVFNHIEIVLEDRYFFIDSNLDKLFNLIYKDKNILYTIKIYYNGSDKRIEVDIYNDCYYEKLKSINSINQYRFFGKSIKIYLNNDNLFDYFKIDENANFFIGKDKYNDFIVHTYIQQFFNSDGSLNKIEKHIKGWKQEERTKFPYNVFYESGSLSYSEIVDILELQILSLSLPHLSYLIPEVYQDSVVDYNDPLVKQRYELFWMLTQ